MAYTIAVCKFTAGLALFCGFYILVGYKVVEDDSYSVLIKYLFKACLLELIYRHRGSYIVSQNDIKLCCDTCGKFVNLSRDDLRKRVKGVLSKKEENQ